MTQLLSDPGAPERPITLREYVEASLRQKIASGELPPGTKLVERKLCSTFRVSRSLVREALRTLEAERLITVIPHKGPMVSRIDLETVLELYSVRRLLEGYAVNLFTEHASESQIHELGAIIDEFGDLVDRGAPQLRLSKNKDEIYEIILNGCGNRVLQELFVTLLSRIDLYRSMSLNSPGRPLRTYKEIELLYKNIVARDAAAAQAAAEIHVENAKTIVLAELQSRGHH